LGSLNPQNLDITVVALRRAFKSSIAFGTEPRRPAVLATRSQVPLMARSLCRRWQWRVRIR